jgi:putative tricarboxylic transport membrane protein
MKNAYDIIGGGLLCAIGVGAGIQSVALKIGSPTEPQPGFFPFIGSALLVLFSVIIIAQGFVGAERERTPHGNAWRPLPLILVLAALAPAIDVLGYVLSTFITAAFVLRIMGVKTWPVTVLTGLCLSVGTFLLFDRLLGVQLPVGVLSGLGL